MPLFIDAVLLVFLVSFILSHTVMAKRSTKGAQHGIDLFRNCMSVHLGDVRSRCTGSDLLCPDDRRKYRFAVFIRLRYPKLS